MSCYVIETDAIHYLVATTRRYRWYTTMSCPEGRESDALGQMLVDANYRSVNERYREDNAPAEPYSYDYRFDAVPLDPVQVIKTARCLAYQSCDAESWDGSDAERVLRRIIDRAIDMLPGYGDAAWGPPKLALPPKRPVRPIRRAS